MTGELRGGSSVGSSLDTFASGAFLVHVGCHSPVPVFSGPRLWKHRTDR